MKKIRKYTFIILSTLAITSCEKEDDNLEITNQNIEENIEENNAEILQAEVVLSRTYDRSLLSKEEANAQFEKEIATYMSSQKGSENKATLSFYIKVGTSTGNDTNNGSTSTIKTKLIFNTNAGLRQTASLDLGTNHPKNHEQNSLWKINSSVFIEWIEAQDMEFTVSGLDDWRPTYLDTVIHEKNQDGSAAKGQTMIFGFEEDLTIVGKLGFLNYIIPGKYTTKGEGHYSRLGRITFPSPPAVAIGR